MQTIYSYYLLMQPLGWLTVIYKKKIMLAEIYSRKFNHRLNSFEKRCETHCWCWCICTPSSNWVTFQESLQRCILDINLRLLEGGGGRRRV